jgi:hypothetical protein
MPPTSPRFRFRDPRGREVEVASVEELAQRVAEGEVGEGTPLFDAGTGLWQEAGQLPVFRFVVEELREEGRLPPADEDPGAVAPDVDGEESTSPLLPLTPDPFELHLPLRSTIRGSEASGSEADEKAGDGAGRATEEPDPGEPGEGYGGAGAQGSAAAEPPPAWRSELLGGLDDLVPDFPPEEEERAEGTGATGGAGQELEGEGITWGLPLPAREPAPEEPGAVPPRASEEEAAGESGGVGAGWEEEGPLEDSPPPPPFPLDARARTPSRPRDRPRPTAPVPTPGPGGGEEGADLSDPFREAPRASPRPESVQPVGTRSRDRRVVGVFGVTGVLLVLVAGLVVISSREGSAPLDPVATAAGGAGTSLSARDVAVPPPPELESTTEEILSALAMSMGLWADSLRQEAELEDGPPRGWLGGFYLAHAGDFPQVLEFWRAYRIFLGELRDRDADRYRTAAQEVAAAHVPPGVEPDVVEGYLEERYGVLGPLRGDRYATLIRVSEAAEALHHFLVEAQDRIVHAPALGRGISPDPILEAVPTDEETRTGLDDLLDALFQALDRSRGGGPPSFEGLRADLFERFDQPV